MYHNECPICFDAIGVNNNITTECGHKFHASCLMTNISRNGFGCPCCRAVMVEEHEDADTDDDDETSTLLDEDEDDEEEDEPYSDYALRGLRLLTSLLEGVEQDSADIVDENALINDVEDEITPVVPSYQYVTNSLVQQGVSYEQLVAWIMLDHEEYYDKEEELEEFTTDIWGKLRILISNYDVTQESVTQESVTQESVTQESVVQESVVQGSVAQEPYLAELSNNVTIRENRRLKFADIDDVRMDLAKSVIDYSAQPKSIIVD